MQTNEQGSTYPTEEELHTLLEEWQRDLTEAEQMLRKQEKWEKVERYFAGLVSGIILTIAIELVFLFLRG